MKRQTERQTKRDSNFIFIDVLIYKKRERQEEGRKGRKWKGENKKKRKGKEREKKKREEKGR